MHSGRHNSCGADTWMAGFPLMFPLQNERRGWCEEFPQWDKRKSKESNYLPHSAAVIVFLCALPLPRISPSIPEQQCHGQEELLCHRRHRRRRHEEG
jgi:hypothetical protein